MTVTRGRHCCTTACMLDLAPCLQPARATCSRQSTEPVYHRHLLRSSHPMDPGRYSAVTYRHIPSRDWPKTIAAISSLRRAWEASIDRLSHRECGDNSIRRSHCAEATISLSVHVAS